MGWQWCAVALCALAIGAGAYTVDCNHEYTDCETELSKLSSDDDEPAPVSTAIPELVVITSTSPPPTSPTPPRELTTPPPPETTTKIQEPPEITETIETTETPKQPRLLNLNVDELQNFANALHNETVKQNKQKIDLSDVNMDDEDEEPPRLITHDHNKHDKTMPDKFYTNLQEPFHGLLSIDRASEEIDTCKENEISYKIGDTIERGCEETCECSPGGSFDCTPRCKHPYIRRGRRLNDPLCFESPVDECCSIIACASGNQDLKVSKVEICRYNNDTHTVGEQWHIGCEQTCSCEANSVVTCKPRCKKLEPSDKCINVQDPNDECCEVQVCDVSQDVHEEPLEGNTTSASTTTTTPQSVKVFDDYSDVVQNTPETRELQPTSSSTTTYKPITEPIGSVKVLQNNSVQVNLQHVNSSDDPVHLLLSSDGGKNFEDVELKYSNLIIDLPRGKDYILKTKETGTKFNFTMTTIKDEMVADNGSISIKERIGCNHDGQFYEVGEEFHIGCTELCECTGDETKQCVELVCPNHVGLELVSKGCVKWAPNPPAEPPNCCPRTARCLSDGTCHYKGVAVPNWSEVSISLTGCSQRCFCENGELECQEVCSPLSPLPPNTLRCPPLHRPAPVNISDDDCCKQWGCVPNGQSDMKPSGPADFIPTIPPEIHFPTDDIPDYDQNNLHRPINSRDPILTGFPPGLTIPPNYGDENKKLTVLSIQADSPTSVKLLFGLPPVLVGLRGSVDLRYTDQPDEDISHWYSQVFAPADEVLTTPRLEFRLTGLKPSTIYRIKGKLFLHNLPVEPQSQVYTVRTLDLPAVIPLEEKRKEIDCRLMLIDVNDTAAHVSWRHFTEEELQFIDGIQVRYRPVGTPIYSMTELLHHSRSIAELHDLRPNTKYEASLILVPPPRATTELHDPGRVEFTTAPFVDPYNWTVTIEAHVVGSDAAELTWRGVPSPAERWVRVYRAAHACGASRHEHDAFRLATRDLPPTIVLSGLDSSARCRVWMELFLTNGKIKTSNVLEIVTKSQDSPEEIDNEIEASSIAGARGEGRGDYYGALVVVGVVAALGAMTSLLLLLVLVRRHRPRSVPITPVPTAPRDSSLPPYDNPAYKLELQQETMDL